MIGLDIRIKNESDNFLYKIIKGISTEITFNKKHITGIRRQPLDHLTVLRG